MFSHFNTRHWVHITINMDNDNGIRKTIALYGDDLLFDEGPHIYTYKGEEMTSATTLLKDFFPFDREKIADVCLNGRNPKYKDCETRDDVWAIWEAKAQFGTDVHNVCEDYLNNKFVTLDNDRQIRAFNYVSKMKFEDVLPEVQIVAPEWGISGMIDCLIKIDGKWWIYDWKTDARIMEKSYNGEKCTGFLSDFDNCNINKFSFQLGLYKMILETFYDVQIAGLKVVHFDENATKEYPLKYHKEYIGLIVKKFMEKKSI